MKIEKLVGIQHDIKDTMFFVDIFYVEKLIFRLDGVCEAHSSKFKYPREITYDEGSFLETGYPVQIPDSPLLIPDKDLVVLTEKRDGTYFEGLRNLVSAKAVSLGVDRNDISKSTQFSIAGLNHEELEKYYSYKFPNCDIYDDSNPIHITIDEDKFDEFIEEGLSFKEHLRNEKQSKFENTDLF